MDSGFSQVSTKELESLSKYSILFYNHIRKSLLRMYCMNMLMEHKPEIIQTADDSFRCLRSVRASGGASQCREFVSLITSPLIKQLARRRQMGIQGAE